MAVWGKGKDERMHVCKGLAHQVEAQVDEEAGAGGGVAVDLQHV